MELAPALAVGIGLPAVALVIGLVWRARTGRVQRLGGASGIPAGAASAIRPGATPARSDAERLQLEPAALGDGATLVQFSTEYCSRCPGTARALVELASEYDGVRHVEIDLTHRADLADAFRVTQTPTVLVLDPSGRAVARIAGVPRIDELRDELDTTTGRSRAIHPV
ncbi:thioredoxin family protein [Agromyces sp. GXS1127]|uniref:thioredoxin family protein n=1 Tax=Agromyces sp. GXS1127 TaxID=3424181 RepID=UPI003D318DDF